VDSGGSNLRAKKTQSRVKNQKRPTALHLVFCGAPAPLVLGQPCRQVQGALKKKTMHLPTYLFFSKDFFNIFTKVFVAFLSSSCRETAKKRDKKSKGGNDRKKSFGKKFSTCIFPKELFWCF
jgi:hypothetical protein